MSRGSWLDSLTLLLKCFCTCRLWLQCVSPCVHNHIWKHFQALWVTGLLLCASAHWVQRKKWGKVRQRRGEKVNKMAGETASITTARSTAHGGPPQRSENLTSHVPSIIQTSVTAFAAQLWLSHVRSLGITSQDCPYFTKTTHSDLHLASRWTFLWTFPALGDRCFTSETFSDVAPNDKPIVTLDYLPPAWPYAAVEQMGRYIFPHPERAWGWWRPGEDKSGGRGYRSVVTD